MGVINVEGLLLRRFIEINFAVPWGGAGPYNPFWMANHSLVRQMIKEKGYKPAAEGMLAAHMAALSMETGERSEAVSKMKRPIPGGIRVPHLHFDTDIFLLDESQWKDFSAKMMKEFQAKLSRVNAVSFEQAMAISEAVDTLA